MAISVSSAPTYTGSIGVTDVGYTGGPIKVTDVGYTGGPISVSNAPTYSLPATQTAAPWYEAALNEALSLANANSASGALPKVYAPFLDTDSIWSQARAGAAKLYGMSNPNSFFAQELKKYTDEIGAQEAAAKTQADMTNQFADAYLQDFMARQATTQGRVQEDVTSGVATAEQGYKLYEKGSNMNKEYGMAQLRSDIAMGNLTTSGIGRQQLGKFIASSNLQDETASAQYEQEKQKLVQWGSRSIQDIVADNASKQREHVEGEKQTAFDLTKTVRELAFQLSSKQTDLELQRQDAELKESATVAGNLFRQWAGGYGSDPATFEAIMQTYGSAF